MGAARQNVGEPAVALTAREHALAEKITSAVNRQRYLQGRILLRRLLSAYLMTPVEAVPLQVAGNGQSYLAPHLGESLRFSFSHAHDVAVCALSPCLDLGVALECRRSMSRSRDIAESFFTRDERQLACRGGVIDGQRFLKIWARKEALAKATGLGMWTTAAQISVVSPTLALRRVVFYRHDRWKLCDFQYGDHHFGAVAVEDQVIRLCHFRFGDLHSCRYAA